MSSHSSRGIESIAHLFLSQSCHPDNKQAKQNLRPIFKSTPYHTDTKDSPNGHIDSGSQKNINPGQIVLANHLDNPVAALQSYGKTIAERDEQIAMVSVDHFEAKWIAPVWGNSNEQYEYPDNIICETEDISNGLIPALQELTNGSSAFGHCDDLLIYVDESFGNRNGDLMKHFDYITVITTCKTQDIIESYKAVKSLDPVLRSRCEISVFIYEAPDTDTADDVYYKVADTARKFLSKVIIPAGCSLRQTAKKPHDDIASLARCLDDINVSEELEPAKKDILTATEDDNLETTLESQPDTTLEPGLPRTLYAVPIDNYPDSDEQLIDILHIHLLKWLSKMADVIMLSLPEMPFSAARILVDGKGQMHILLAELSGQENPAKQIASIHDWVVKNLLLITGRYRQLRIDSAMVIGVILVSGEPIETLGPQLKTITDIPCQVYQLYFLENEKGKSLLAVPV